jgi:hypothetical protein
MGWMKTAVTYLSFRQHPNPASATSSPCCQTDDLKAPPRGEIRWEVRPNGEQKKKKTYRGPLRDLHPFD